MYSGLGFVGGGSRPPETRDAHFTGSSGHLSKRNFSHAQRKIVTDDAFQPQSVPIQSIAPPQKTHPLPAENVDHPLTEQNTMFQRYQFVESQMKKHGGEIADIHANLDQIRQNQESNQVVHRAWATSIRKLPFFKIADTEEHIESKLNKSDYDGWIDPNQDVMLLYPMKEINDQVWMKLMQIDEEIGSIQYAWLQIANEKDGRGVHKFRI